MGMGSGSYGPVMVKVDNSHRGTLEFVDLETLEKIDVTWSKKKPSLSHPVNFNPTLICASAAGRVFSVSNEGVMRLEGSNVTQYSSIRVSNGPSIPSSDGSRVVYNGKILKCPLIQVSEQSVNYGMTVPAISAPYFISYKWPGPSDRAPVTQTAKLYWFEDLQLLATFESTGPFTDGRMQGKTISSALRRVFLVPQSNILATFAKTSDKLVLHRLDVEQLLAESGKDYFYVDSMAPPLARLKSKFEYQVKAKAKHGGLKYSLEAAPTGMQVSSLGKITWEVPQGYGEERVNVIVEIENSKGRSVFHPFEIGFPELARLTERKRIAKKKQYRKQVKLAEEKRRRTRIAFNTEKSQEERRRRDNARRFSMRDWADKTGKHQIRAQFVRVVDRTTVVLMSPKGKEIKIPLEKLSDRDIFLAVRNDLQPKTQIEEKTPFEKDGGEQ